MYRDPCVSVRASLSLKYDSGMGEQKIDHDLYRGTLDIIILTLLSERRDHGYGLIERLRAQSNGQLSISEGAVYPLLHKLESKKLIGSEWVLSSNNRRTKQYFITDTGHKTMESRANQWEQLVGVIRGLRAGGEPTDVSGQCI